MRILDPTASPLNNAPLIQGLWIGKLGMLERLSMKPFLTHGHSYHLYAYDTRNVLMLGLERYVKSPEIFNPIDWYRSATLTSQAGQNQIPVSSYSIHCYRETWRWRQKDQKPGEFRNRIFPPNTLLGDLQHRYVADEISSSL